MSDLRMPRHYREARRMDAQQRAYDDVAKRRWGGFRPRWATSIVNDPERLDALLAGATTMFATTETERRGSE